ncbi:hypothetical protein DEJ17_09060 [Curtobacterium sp. MCSS17_011]|uniref:hypothetical protein n=1 Tax=Curtobacterium sp. MCSS17_011 TaxID=2175643 RepID=UPI000D8DD47E|nr:hypothetical protein [Curtobacterium sp. MCSS17_011]PYY57835.1 hypothetical protein DEJ17_09060 [Curtobacterium sp. MCSS17_011]
MDQEGDRPLRVYFYGPDDGAVGIFVPRVVELASKFEPGTAFGTATDALEHHNVQKYLEHRLLPSGLDEKAIQQLLQKVRPLRAAIARFFSAISEDNFQDAFASVDHQYHRDLLEVLGQVKAFERFDGPRMLGVLKETGVHIGDMLESAKLVQAYGEEIRLEILASSRNAELIVRKYLESASRRDLHLPVVFTPDDSRHVLEEYIDSEEANLNYVRLIANAKENARVGIDSKLKLRAKRRAQKLNAALFTGNVGLRATYEVAISGDQEQPSIEERKQGEDSHWLYSYSRTWLDSTRDNSSILNNFQHLFGFVDDQVLLGLPAFAADLGVFERMAGLAGLDEYKHGLAFDALDSVSLLQTQMYTLYLKKEGIDLERVLAWFFVEYLPKEFGIRNFSLRASGEGASFLEKVRHLFAEIESVSAQFELYAENGEVDHELLNMRSDPVAYGGIPSLVQGKYVYAGDNDGFAAVLSLLFFDQSRIIYIDENLNASDFVRLILQNSVRYADFHEYQVSAIDYLIDEGVIENFDGLIRFVNLEQIRVLHALFHKEAVSYFRLTKPGRVAVDDMLAKGWLVRRSTLLTDAEAAYFNYVLNRTFSNGLNLRNQYLHGSQPFSDEDGAYYKDYLIALRLAVTLVIKMNDDVCLLHPLKDRGDS